MFRWGPQWAVMGALVLDYGGNILIASGEGILGSGIYSEEFDVSESSGALDFDAARISKLSLNVCKKWEQTQFGPAGIVWHRYIYIYISFYITSIAFLCWISLCLWVILGIYPFYLKLGMQLGTTLNSNIVLIGMFVVSFQLKNSL